MYDLGYVVGVLSGDGSFYHNHSSGYRILLGATDESFVSRFKEALGKILGKRLKVWSYRAKTRANPQIKMPACNLTIFRTVAYSKRGFYFLKQLRQEVLEHCPKEKHFLRGFINGFFDSEGCFHIPKSGYSQVRFYNSNLLLLRRIAEMLKELGISISGIYPHERESCLAIYRRGEVERFKNLVVESSKLKGRFKNG